MELSRRQFFQASATAVATTAFGFDLSHAAARAKELKIARTTQTTSVCPYCAVGCGVVIHSLGDRAKNVRPTVVHVEGDTESPINRGTLCPKGISLKHYVVNDRRLTEPLYRAPGASEWQRLSWDEAIELMARRIKRFARRRFRGDGRFGPHRQPAHQRSAHRRLHGHERDQLSPRQVSLRSRSFDLREPSSSLTRPHGGQSGRHLRPGGHDERMDGRCEHGRRSRDGRQSGREPSRRLPLRDGREAPPQSQARLRRPAVQPHGRRVRPIRSDPGRK